MKIGLWSAKSQIKAGEFVFIVMHGNPEFCFPLPED